MCAHSSTLFRGVRASFTHALLLLYSCFTRALSTLNFAYEEPENALSVPTWAIHFSSVFEWMFAMRLVWDYSEVCVHTLLVRLLMLVLLHYSCFPGGNIGDAACVGLFGGGMSIYSVTLIC